ncbi:MAG: hypothetical protein DMF54_14120 [Acidobacteria bacterium]|nr:MAG: hypothetical protein DMF54_14120 [Acidobacteriota bacterium]
MKISLRERFGILILPMIGIQLLCFLAIVLPSLSIPDDLRLLERRLRQRTAAAALARLLDRQAKTCVDFALQSDSEHHRKLEDQQAAVRSALARWQALRRQDGALSREEARGASEIERDYGLIDQVTSKIVGAASTSRNGEAIDRIRDEFAPLLAQLEEKEDRSIEIADAEILKTIANLNGRLSVANLATLGRFSSDLDGASVKASRALTTDQFSRHLSRELFLYDLSVALGRNDLGLIAVQEDTRDSLESMRKLVESNNAPGSTRETGTVRKIEESYGQVARTGVRLVALVAAGRRSDAIEILNRELPVSENEIAPLVDQVVATDAAEIELAFATLSTRLRWVLLLLGGLSLLGLAIGVGSPLLIHKQILQPVVKLRDLATRLGAGDLHVRAPVDSRNELGELSRAFNKMAVLLEIRTHEMRTLVELGDHLQACKTIEEACLVLTPIARALFPHDSGDIYLFAPSRDVLEPLVTWGEASPAAAFAPDECWAVRRGRIHAVVNERRAPVCEHVSNGGSYLCSPMSAQGEMVGVLHLRFGVIDGDDTGETIEERQRVALSVADQFGLALANLRLRETLRNLSIRDPLTGLFNRRYLEESLERELRRAARRRLPVAVLMIDIDHFKGFNDTFGHEAGDLVLNEVAALLRLNTRAEDIACRYGGEELTLILPEMTSESARLKAEQLREGIRSLTVRQEQQLLGPVTASIGVAIFPENGASGREILQVADAALYRAKQSGRDRVEVANAPLEVNRMALGG